MTRPSAWSIPVGLALVSSLIGSAAAAGSSPAVAPTVVQQWFGEVDDNADAFAAILRNDTTGFLGHLEGRITFLRHGVAYLEESVEPEKTVLAPGEETVAYLYHTDPDSSFTGPEPPPTEVRLEISGERVGAEEYPDAPDPVLVFGEVLQARGYRPHWTRVSVELRNESAVPYGTVLYGQDSQRAFTGVLLLFDTNGRVVGVERLDVWDGNLPPGASVWYVGGTVATGDPAYARSFVAARPLAPGRYPMRWSNESFGWDIVQSHRCGNYPDPCERLRVTGVVRNASDVPGKAQVWLVLRGNHGEPLTRANCPLALIDPGESAACEAEVSDWEWPSGIDLGKEPLQLEDVKYLTIEVTSVESTGNAEFGAPKNGGATCYVRAAQEARPEPGPGPFRVFLPRVANETAYCHRVVASVGPGG